MSEEYGVYFRGIRCPPSEEQGVVALFAVLLPELGFEVEHLGTAFPDCIASRVTDAGRHRVAIEFEFSGRGALRHPDLANCDLVVCWENDVVLPGVEVLALREIVAELTGVTFPGRATRRSTPTTPELVALTVEELLDRRNVPAERRAVFAVADAQLRGLGHVSATVQSNWYVRYGMDGDLLAYISFSDAKMRVDLFTGGRPLEGVGFSKVANHKPFWVAGDGDLPALSVAIVESYRRLAAAQAEGRPRGYYGPPAWQE